METSWIITACAAFLAAILSGLGVGSAGIFVLYLTAWAGLGQAEAQGVNLLFYLISGGASMLFHVRRREIPWRLVVCLVVCAIPGTLLGTYLVRMMDADLLRRLFGGMLVVTGLPVLLRRPRRRKKTKNRLA